MENQDKPETCKERMTRLVEQSKARAEARSDANSQRPSALRELWAKNRIIILCALIVAAPIIYNQIWPSNNTKEVQEMIDNRIKSLESEIQFNSILLAESQVKEKILQDSLTAITERIQLHAGSINKLNKDLNEKIKATRNFSVDDIQLYFTTRYKDRQ